MKMKSHYHPPRNRSALCISDEKIKYIASMIVRTAEEKIYEVPVKANFENVPSWEENKNTPSQYATAAG